MSKRLAVFLGALWMAMPAIAEEQKITMRIDNMTCATCPIIVRTAVGKVAGVSSVEVDMGAKTAVIVFDNALATSEQLAEASLNAGFPAVIEE
jgi:mercuric ion binding protein